MNVALITPWSDPRCGICDYSQTMVKYISQRSEIERVSVVAEVNAQTSGINSKVNVIGVWGANNPLRICSALSKITEQIVHLNFTYLRQSYGGTAGEPLMALAVLAKKLKKIPVVMTLHDVWVKDALKRWVTEFRGMPRTLAYSFAAYLSEVTRLVLTNLDATVVFTQTQRNAILNEYHSHDLRINVISHGCEDRRIYREYGEELKYELGLEADPIIIMLGYIWNGKGAEELIKAMRYIVKESPKALLLVAGPLHFGSNYDYINRLYQLATKENVRPNVRIMVRMLSKEEMYRYSALADVAFIARKTRALSASGLYHIAVSTLTPVIAFEEPVMKEHTTAGGGILLKSLSPSHIAERILAFLDDSNLRKSQAKKMSEYLGKNLWSDLASQYVGLYGEALSSTHTN